MSVTTVQPAWLASVRASYEDDEVAQHLLQKLAVAPAEDGNYTLDHGILRYKGRIWVGGDEQLQQRIISAFHDSPQGGHSGFPVTYRRLVSLFKWTSMKSMTKGICENLSYLPASKAGENPSTRSTAAIANTI
jgi:hypothetical protein